MSNFKRNLDFILIKSVCRHLCPQTDQQQYVEASQYFDLKKLHSLYFVFPCMTQSAINQTTRGNPIKLQMQLYFNTCFLMHMYIIM